MRLDGNETSVIEIGLTAAVEAAHDDHDRIDRTTGTHAVRTIEGRLMATIVLCGRWITAIDRAPVVLTGGVELPDYLHRELPAVTCFAMAASADWEDRFRDEPRMHEALRDALDRLKARAFPSWDRQPCPPPAFDAAR